MYTALDLSIYIVSKCIEDDHPISNLQLQKILYYIQKAFLKRGEIAFNDNIEAWQFGPVVPNVYYYYCSYGSMPISNVFRTFTIEDKRSALEINRIVEEKRILDPWTLVDETHKENGAWKQIYCDGSGNHNVIPVELIRNEE